MDNISKRYGPTSPALRHPQRVTATIAWHVLQALQRRADDEGRSLSNLIAYELERSVRQRQC